MPTVHSEKRSLIQRIEDFISAPADLKYEKQEHLYTKKQLEAQLKTNEVLFIDLGRKTDAYSELVKLHEHRLTKYGELHNNYELLSVKLIRFEEEEQNLVNRDIEKLRIEAQERDKDVLKLKQDVALLTEDLAKAQAELQDRTVTVSTLLTEIGNLNRKHDNLLKARAKRGK